MFVTEILLLGVFLLIGIISSITDLRSGCIYNKFLWPAYVAAVVLDIVYYAFFAEDIFFDFLENIVLLLILLAFIYFTHTFAGGDIKLEVVLAALYPARMYISYNGITVTLFWSLGIAIIIGYVYLLLISIVRLIRKESHLTREYGMSFLRRLVVSYLRSTVYVMGMLLVFRLLLQNLQLPAWLTWLTGFLLVMITRRVKFLQRRTVIALAIAFDVIISILLRVIPFSIFPETYLFAGILVLCQMMISTGLYEEIKTQDVKKGMILSTVSTMAMQNSRVRGLPGISKEDLSSRLSCDQADSVVRWGKTKKGQSTVTVVRKIPFAVFLLIGYIVYFVLWRIQNAI